MSFSIDQIPAGVGVAWRTQLAPILFKYPALADFLEVPLHLYTIERYQQDDDPGWHLLRQAAETFPLISHGPCLSIGSAESPDGISLNNVRKIIEHFPVRSFSEHLCFMQLGESVTTAFISLPFNDMAVETVIKNIKYIQEQLGVPFLIENITQHFIFSSGAMTEAEFITKVVEGADCGILLDVANVFINAKNHNYDPYEFIDALPADRIQQSHFCGASYVQQEDYFYDTHSQQTIPPIWNLLEYALNKTNLNTLIYERDSRLYYQNEVISDLWQAKELYLKYRKVPEILAPVTNKPLISNKRPVNEYNTDLNSFQSAFLRLLIDPELEADYEKHGIDVLSDYQLDMESRACIESVNSNQRMRLSKYIRTKPAQPEIKKLNESIMPDTYVDVLK